MSEHLTLQSRETRKTGAADVCAVTLSSLCVLHCLALPVLIVLVPSLAVLPIAEEKFHFFLVFLVIPVSISALYLGCRRHRRWAVLFWGLTGVGVLILTALYGHEFLGEKGEKIMTVAGAALIAVSHILNFRLCRARACAH